MLVSGAKDPLAEALDALPANERLLLAVDQLEELFTACRSEAERAAFADTLARAAADPEGRAVVVVALRADFYGRFAAYPGLAELLGANHVLVGPMQASELRRVVELPAGRVGLRVEPELADALVDDVEGEPGALPLLSTALLELWQKRQDNALTLAAYRESGGVHGAVARLAEGTYARIPDGRKPLVRAIMLRLVGEGEGDAPVRRRAPLAELDLERNEDVADVLATLADSRLVTVGEGSVEVAHEALLREWPRLREWIEEDAEGRRLRRHITQAATEWDAAGRDQGELYRGARLAAALDWTADHALDLNELEREFVTESREVSEQETKRARRTNRRLRALLAGVAVLLVAALAGGIFALIQRGEARDAETAQLAQRLGAQALVEEDLDRSLLLARQAVAIDDSPQTRSYLLADLLRAPAVIGSHARRGRHPPRDRGQPRREDACGRRFATGLLFFDARTYERIGEPLPVTGGGARASRTAPTGETLAFGGRRLIVRLIDARTRRAAGSGDARVRGDDVGQSPDGLHEDGSQLVVVVAPGAGEPRRTDAAITHPRRRHPGADRSSDRAGRLRRRLRRFLLCNRPVSRSRPTVARSSPRRTKTSSCGGISGAARRRGRLEIGTGQHALALSPDGRTVAVGIDRGIQLVDTRSGAVRTAAGALGGAPNWLLFSPDGRTVVSTSLDGTVALWDAESATRRETLRGHSGAVQQPVFSPDGETLYTVSHDGTAIAWDLGGDRGLGRRFTFTHDRTSRRLMTGTPGASAPTDGLIAVGLKERGISALGCDGPDPGRPAPPRDRRRGQGARLRSGRANARSRDRRGPGDALGRRVADRCSDGPFTVAPGAVLAASASAPTGTIARHGRARPPAWTSGTSQPETVSTRSRLGVGVERRRLQPDGVDASRSSTSGEARGGLGRRPTRTSDRHAVDGDADVRRTSAIALSPDGRALAIGGLDGTIVRVWDVRTGKLVRELDQGERRRDDARLQPRRPDPRRLRLRARRVALGRCHRSPDRPDAHGRGPQDDDRSLGRRTPAAGDHGRRPGGGLGRRPGVVGAACLRRSRTAR